MKSCPYGPLPETGGAVVEADVVVVAAEVADPPDVVGAVFELVFTEEVDAELAVGAASVDVDEELEEVCDVEANEFAVPAEAFIEATRPPHAVSVTAIAAAVNIGTNLLCNR